MLIYGARSVPKVRACLVGAVLCMPLARAGGARDPQPKRLESLQ